MRRCLGTVLGLRTPRGYDKDDLRRDKTRRNNNHNRNQRRSVWVPEDPADLDPLRFGPGSIPSSFGYDAATLSEFSDCYVDHVLADVEKYFLDDPPTVPIYSALSVEELCCRGVSDVDSVDSEDAPSLSPSMMPSRTRKSKKSKKKNRKRKKAKKKKADNNNRTRPQGGGDKEQQSREPTEQLLGVRFLQDDYIVEDAIIVELCRPANSEPEGHCTIEAPRPVSPTEAPRPTVPL